MACDARSYSAYYRMDFINFVESFECIKDFFSERDRTI